MYYADLCGGIICGVYNARLHILCTLYVHSISLNLFLTRCARGYRPVAVRTFIRMVLSLGVNFGGHVGGQNVQVEQNMLQNGMVTSCVQSAEQIGSKKLAIGKKFECLPVTILFEPICSADCTHF